MTTREARKRKKDRKSQYRIHGWGDMVLNVPPAFVDTRNYTASLGHKVSCRLKGTFLEKWKYTLTWPHLKNFPSKGESREVAQQWVQVPMASEVQWRFWWISMKIVQTNDFALVVSDSVNSVSKQVLVEGLAKLLASTWPETWWLARYELHFHL